MWLIGAYLLAPYAWLKLICRALRYPAYWRRWSERCGYARLPRADMRIWVHAVSVGEVRSVAALIEELRARYPRHRVLITTMTPTGLEQVRALFGDEVDRAYVPFDLPGSVRRFLSCVRPDFAVIAETEFWPNLFAECARRGVPLLLVNVRLSLSSARAYSWAPRTVRRMLRNAALLCAQTRGDAQRLRNLGAPEPRVRVTGNLKFDWSLAPDVRGRAVRLREAWGWRPTLIAGSTHGGEEAQLLAAYTEIRRHVPDALLVIVPRHPERFSAVVRLCRRRGFVTAVRTVSGDAPLAAEVQVYVGDTMGELQSLYAAADLAFVGGSLVRRGGQNLLEACAVGVPVIFGPHMFNCEEVSALALEYGAGCQVQDRAELVTAVLRYLSAPALRAAASRAAERLVAENRGALAKTLEAIAEILRREDRRTHSADDLSAARQLAPLDQDRA
jgi:3-deoxy-D-manno-octulosonic-acid transferase